MIRPDRELHELKVTDWTRDEAAVHLEATFDAAARQRPDLMEPYMIRLNAATEAEQLAIQREGLRDTFALRHPSRIAKRADASAERSD